MLDISHLTKLTPSNVDYIYNTGGTTSWQTWEKPRGIIMLEIICIGAGGGGRSGWSLLNANRTGGGGGGSGGFSRLLIPAVFLPDVLYVTVGRGGVGGAPTTTGTANAGFDGSFSSVNIAPTNSAFYIVCYANAGAGAVVGSAAAGGGTAGVGAGVAVQTTALMSNLGIFSALAGQSGGTGTRTPTVALTYPTTGLLLSGGGAGGGGQTVGGDITTPTQSSFSLIPTRTGGQPGDVGVPGSPGADGITLLQPLMSIGGAGGGANLNTASSNTGGGRGGNGGLGSGGGGGGAGGTGSPGSGAGGNGGDGLVIIRSW